MFNHTISVNTKNGVVNYTLSLTYKMCIRDSLNGEEDAPRVLIAAHMDEVGFLVKQIEKGGFLRLHNVGGWWGHVIPAHEWVVTTRDGKEYIGVTGAQPPHGMPAEQRNKVMELKDMYLDMGVGSDEDLSLIHI